MVIYLQSNRQLFRRLQKQRISKNICIPKWFNFEQKVRKILKISQKKKREKSSNIDSKMVAQEPESSSKEPRMEFLADYTLKTLRLKPDKWARMIVSDEQRNFILSFIDKGKNKFICT